MSEPQAAGPPADQQPVATRTISEVEALRAMADSTRLSILYALMESRDGELPVMSAKELSALLGQPQTKLYRHLRQLESAGLIRVAATRMVSGILEQRFQACQRDFEFGSGFLREHADDSEAIIGAMLAKFRDGYVASFRDKRLAPEVVPESETYRLSKIYVSDVRVSAATAAAMRSQLVDLMSGLTAITEEVPDGTLVHVLVGYYRDVDDADQSTEAPA